MNQISIKTIVLSLFLFLNLTVFAQNDFQGKAFYQSKTKVDLDQLGGKKLPPERKKMIMERMKNMFEKTYLLTFNKIESSYQEEQKLNTPGVPTGFRGMMGSFTPGSQYKNIKENVFLQDQEFFGKQFLIKDRLEKLEWKITGETKQIGKYNCMKATAMKKADKMDWASMRRKNKAKNIESEKGESKQRDSSAIASNNLMDQIEIPKEIEVTAWYTMEIPVNNGPGDFWGLPGLILEVSSGKTTILCSKIVMNPENVEEIKRPSKGKEVTKEEYASIVKNKMEEMREMYGGKNRKGRRF